MRLRLILAIVAGLGVGAATELSVRHLPDSLSPIGNSAGPWILVAFVMALTAPRLSESLLLGLVTLIALVVGFYVAQANRGWAVSHHQVVFWSLASLVAGPLVGLSAGWLRHAGRTAGAAGAGVLGGVLVGEALHGITKLQYSTPARYWHVQLVVGVGLAVGLALWRARRHPASALAASLVVCAVVGVCTLVAYQAP